MMSWTRKVVLWLFAVCWVCDGRTIKEAEGRDDGKTVFELDEILNGTFSSSSWNGTWLTDTEFLYKNGNGDVIKYNLEDRMTEIFIAADVLTNYTGASISISPDQAFILIRYDVSSVFRHSTTSRFTVYDLTNQVYYPIADSNPIQLAAFAPTGHGLVYVFNNNIYYLEDFQVDTANPINVTTIGEPGVVYCGVPDWVYEEEVLGSGSALWVSPDATHIAYAVFQDHNVTEFSYYIYGTPGSADAQYPTEATIKYPKVGTPNPLVSVYLYDIAAGTNIEFQLPSSIDNKNTNDYVLYDLTWVSSTDIAMISTNRIQNESITIRCTLDGSCGEEDSYTEDKGWLSPAIPRYNKDGTKKLEILPQPEGDDKFFHLVLTDIATSNKTRLTHGRRVVTSLYGWDEDKGLIYYSGTVIDTPSQQQVYVVSTSGEDNCLTCDWVVDEDTCQYASASFSKALSYHVRVCSGPNPIYVQLENTYNATDLLVWQENLSLRQKLASKLLPVIKKLTVPINEQFNARVKMLLPPNLDETSSKKYPAIVNVYAGPNSNQISDSFSLGIPAYMVTNREYIYIYIDGRGSGKDGHNKMFQVYKNLATVEIEDQITVTKYLQQNFPYIDETRTGIWGWSYGGFASSWALVKDKDHVFNFALAVAPVTSFVYYDTIYTERYMGLPTPEDNEIGYNNTDLTRQVEAFRGRRYFIIHGNADDNVHYQNSMLLVKALEYADVDFRQQSYPDENHSLGHVSRHLYHTIDKFWARCFELEDPPVTGWHKGENF
ncbi:hypothetical protein NQ315_008163 [Exocentrus adspersus]|uniref:Venom dipeptidyl peptidase 4 n=1 Tax=Exocentrus adspersus TaxID=1586481 RepID=A0AAV8VVN8_9CUCU|nr:hypothetical protein NQ315_008163 [Exocentrus adspersus]